MSLTRILCEKCGCPFAFCACDRIAAPDGPANDKPLPEEHQKAPPDGAKETADAGDPELTEDFHALYAQFVERGKEIEQLELQRNALRRELSEAKEISEAALKEVQWFQDECKAAGISSLDIASVVIAQRERLATVEMKRDQWKDIAEDIQKQRDDCRAQLALAQRDYQDLQRLRDCQLNAANDRIHALTAATQELEGLRADREKERLQDMLPSEIAARLGQIHEGYPASEQHTKCAALITQLRQELERYEESRPMSEHEQKMINDGLAKFSAARTKETPRHETH